MTHATSKIKKSKPKRARRNRDAEDLMKGAIIVGGALALSHYLSERR
jgi:hypothetical protein